MGWGGESILHVEQDRTIRRAIARSEKIIRSLGVIHQDLRPENILWNTELNRALIIDFHRCSLDHGLIRQRPKVIKRQSCGVGEQELKRARVGGLN